MAHKGCTDTDMGLANILKEVEKLKSMCVKVGIPEKEGSETVDGVRIAQYAAWNELGVMNKDESDWYIPPRPFVRGFADGKRELITKTMEKLGGLVTDGKLDADTAIERLGVFGELGVRGYIRNGPFTPNADSTIAKKDSSRPLIDNGTLRDSISYQVIKQPLDKVSEQ